MIYFVFIIFVILLSVGIYNYLEYKSVLPRYRIKETPGGKFVPQFLCLGKAPDLFNASLNPWGWYPLMETGQDGVSFLFKKQFAPSAEVADKYIAEQTIAKFKKRSEEMKASKAKPKSKTKYHYNV